MNSYEDALASHLNHMNKIQSSCLALDILLDQFSLNLICETQRLLREMQEP